MTKLYIGNLPYTTTEDDLKALFADYGAVLSATLITDRDSGRSKGFGFVEMEEEAAANEAIEKLNKSTFQERMIFVSIARAREERPSNGGGGFGGGGGYSNDRRSSGGGDFKRNRNDRGNRR